MNKKSIIAKEELLFDLKLSQLNIIHHINRIVSDGYERTGLKFRIEYFGSKGYLSHVIITCEGVQHNENRVFVEWGSNGGLANIPLKVYFNEHTGVRLSLEDDGPREVEVFLDDNEA